MMRRESFEAENRTLEDVYNNDTPFGGILTICCGDVRHLLQEFVFMTKVSKISKKQNILLDEDGQSYARFLIDVGKEKLPKNNEGGIELPGEMVLPQRNINECLQRVYPSFDNLLEIFSKKCVLMPENESMRNINSICINRFPGNLREQFSFNSVTDGSIPTHFTTGFLDSIKLYGLPPHKLQLKIGSSIMIMRNLDPSRLRNGTRLIDEKIYQNLIVAKIIVSAFGRETVFIPRTKLIL